MSATIEESNLFREVQLGHVKLSNRVVLLPTTRFRSSENHVATDASLKFYADRSRDPGSFVIAEGIVDNPKYGFYPNAPGIWTEEQTAAWKKVTDAVHENGSFMGIQLWQLGRVVPPQVAKAAGLPIYSASAIHFSSEAEAEAKKEGVDIKELTTEEVEQLVEGFATSAVNAIEKAGFDFVEIHAANGYLPNEFLDESSNKRTDKYGGSIENRARMVLESIDAVGKKVGYDHVGIRLSPWSTFQGLPAASEAQINRKVSLGYLLSELERRGKDGARIAYVSVIEPVPFVTDELPSGVPEDNNNSFVADIWKGTIIRGGGYFRDPSYGPVIEDVNSNDRTLIGSARFFTSNPDLRQRVRKGQSLTQYQRPYFYTQGHYGYNTFTDYGIEDLGPDSELAQKPNLPLV